MIIPAGPISAFGQIETLAELPDGWNFGRGRKPSPAARLNARSLSLLTANLGASGHEYFPEADGGILLIAYRGDESFEILACGNGAFEVAFEDATGLEPAATLGTVKEVEAELERHGWQSPKSLGSYTRLITAGGRSDTHRLRFVQSKTGPQSSTQIAFEALGIPVAPMPTYITREAFVDRPLSSGESRQRSLAQAIG
ncbi:MAG: hypothetical protein ABR588_00395 [Sphingomicrobium sp.]|nr:hypothetical protein [Sphingomonadales bacterium]